MGTRRTFICRQRGKQELWENLCDFGCKYTFLFMRRKGRCSMDHVKTEYEDHNLHLMHSFYME